MHYLYSKSYGAALGLSFVISFFIVKQHTQLRIRFLEVVQVVSVIFVSQCHEDVPTHGHGINLPLKFIHSIY